MTPLRIPVNIADTLDRALGDGAADLVSARLGELDEGEAAALVTRGASVYLSCRWFTGGRVWANWWIVGKDARGGLTLAGPTVDPSRT